MERVEVPVLIVGGGPTGLCASIALSRLGVATMLVERHLTVSSFPRSRTVHQRAMEIFRQWGLEEAVYAREVEAEPLMVWAETVAAPPSRQADYVQDSDPTLSPCRISAIYQDQLEPLLLDVATSSSIADVRFCTELISLEFLQAGAKALLRDHRTGADKQVLATYVIAADGAHSGIRGRLGIGMNGPDDLAQTLLIRFRADLSRWTGIVPAAFYFLTGTTVRVLYRTDRDHRWVLNAEDPALAGDPAGAVLRAIGADVPVEILGTPASWIAAAQLADRFRAGPVFLAGDAAHRLTPAGGMGMNTGVQDVHNLAWKLAAVLHGHAGEALLDTYEAERRPTAARNVAWSLDNWTSLRARKTWPSPGNPNTEAIDLGAVYKSAAVVQDQMQDVEDGLERVPSGRPGGRAPHLWLNGPAGPQSTLDLFDRRFTLLTAPAGRAWAKPAAAPTRAPGVPFEVVTITSPRWADAYGVASDGAVLVRPDGHVGWRGRCCSRDSLAGLPAALGDRRKG